MKPFIDAFLTYNLIKSGMSSTFRKRMRQEDLSDYIDAGKMELPLTYEKIGATIKQKCQSLMKIFCRRDRQGLPYYMQESCFYRRVQAFRPLPRRPVGADYLEKVRMIKRGFEPEQVSFHRWSTDEARIQQREDAQKDLIIEKALARRNQQYGCLIDQPRKKVIKRHQINLQEDSQKWELIEKKIYLAADTIRDRSLQEICSQKALEEKFFEPAANLLAAEASGQIQSPASTSTEEPSSPKTLEMLETPKFTPVKQAVDDENPELLRLEDDKTALKSGQSQAQLNKNVAENPFMKSPVKNLSLQDFISSRDPSPSTIFPASQTPFNSLFSAQDNLQPQADALNTPSSTKLTSMNSGAPFSFQKKATESQNSKAQGHVLQNQMSFSTYGQTNQSNTTPQANQFFKNSPSYQAAQSHSQTQPPFQMQVHQQDHQQRTFLNGLSNSSFTSQGVKNMFEESRTKKGDTASIFDNASKKSDKTDRKVPSYNKGGNRRNNSNSVRIL